MCVTKRSSHVSDLVRTSRWAGSGVPSTGDAVYPNPKSAASTRIRDANKL
jgi:hypothetical protein